MKLLKLIFVFAILAAAVVFLSRCDLVDQTEADMRRHGGFELFFDTGCVFDSGTMDVDTSEFKVSFKNVDWEKLKQAVAADDSFRVLMQTDDRVNLEKRGKDAVWLQKLRFKPESKQVDVWARPFSPRDEHLQSRIEGMMERAK